MSLRSLWYVVPQIFSLAFIDHDQALAKSPITKNYDLSSVLEIGSGAAPLSGEVIEECERLWPTGDRKLQVQCPFP